MTAAAQSLARVAEFALPGTRLVNETNAREHWRARSKRAKAQRTGAWAAARAHRVHGPGWLPCVVTITRIGPRELDSDNLAASAKHVRDGIADALGIDDRDRRVTWRVEQERGGPRVYGCRVRIEGAG